MSIFHDRNTSCPWCKNYEVFQGKTVRWEWSLSKNGKTYDLVDTPFYNADKSISKLEIIRDITERKQAEEELKWINEKFRHSHELMHYVISHARSAIAVHDTDLNYIYVSDRYLEEYKVREKDVIGKHHYEVFPDLPQKWRNVHQRCLNGEILSAEEDTYYREEGSVEWTRWECRPWYESGGTIGGIIVYTEVITERKRAEEGMRERGKFIESLINLSPDIIYIYDLVDQKNVYVNDGMQNVLGYSASEVKRIGEQLIPKLMHPEDLKLYLDETIPRYATARDGEKIIHQYRMKSRNDNWHWLECVELVYKRHSNGSPHQIFGVVHDITDRKKADEDLLKLQKLESVGLLAGGIAHDFNNILAAILGNINIALLDSGLSHETQNRLIEAEKASLRAKDLTQQLLTFSKGGEPVKTTASLMEVVQDSAEFILHGDNTVCTYTFPDGLWLVEIDKGQISQVVQNIVQNASQSMPDGGTIEIFCENYNQSESSRTAVLPAGKYIKMWITDSGIGIPKKILGRIFDPYFSTKQKGSGLGLAITNSIIDKHDGNIEVESTPGIGTTFTVFLPAADISRISFQFEQTAANVKITRKIMIMDDEEQIRDMSQAMLKSFGHEIVLAKDGDEALTLYEQSKKSDSPIDLIIMDLTIPGGMGGKETVREVLSMDPNAKVVVSSGYSNDPIMSNFLEYGFCGTLVKPYRRKDLARAINEAFTNSVTRS